MGRLDARVSRLQQQSTAHAAAVRDLLWARCGHGRDWCEAQVALVADVRRAWALGVPAMAEALRRETGATPHLAGTLAALLHREARRLLWLYARDDGVTLATELRTEMERTLDRLTAPPEVLDPTAGIAAILAWCRENEPHQDDAQDADGDAEGFDAA